MKGRQISKNFKESELRVSSDYPEIASAMKISKQMMLNAEHLIITVLQPIADEFGRQKVLSFIRTRELNTLVGGRSGSDHEFGRAADIVPLDAQIETVFLWIVNHPTLEYKQVIYYPGRNFIHISSDINSVMNRKEALVSKFKGKYIPFELYYKSKKEENKNV